MVQISSEVLACFSPKEQTLFVFGFLCVCSLVCLSFYSNDVFLLTEGTKVLVGMGRCAQHNWILPVDFSGYRSVGMIPLVRAERHVVSCNNGRKFHQCFKVSWFGECSHTSNCHPKEHHEYSREKCPSCLQKEVCEPRIPTDSSVARPEQPLKLHTSHSSILHMHNTQRYYAKHCNFNQHN